MVICSGCIRGEGAACAEDLGQTAESTLLARHSLRIKLEQLSRFRATEGHIQQVCLPREKLLQPKSNMIWASVSAHPTLQLLHLCSKNLTVDCRPDAAIPSLGKVTS